MELEFDKKWENGAEKIAEEIMVKDIYRFKMFSEPQYDQYKENHTQAHPVKLLKTTEKIVEAVRRKTTYHMTCRGTIISKPSDSSLEITEVWR